MSFVTTKKITSEMVDELYALIASLETVEDCRLLFDDLCTFKEIEQMAQRLKSAKLLLEGKTYHQVIEETEISSATLSRISRCVQYGGGYTKFLK
ncbi:MAG: YerC/YecD family TrpR-related protein [Bacillota bacterium]|nr:YerC/YecD family TrpR-related protein [Bacillota bacterium]